MSRGNPVISRGISSERCEYGSSTMSVSGAVMKSMLLMLIVGISFIYSYSTTIYNYRPALQTAGIIAFVVAIVTVFVPKLAQFTAIIYAGAEGFALGALSHWFNRIYPGIAAQAILMTIVVAIVTLLIYRSVPTLAQKVSKMVFIGLISIVAIGGLSFLLSFVGIRLPFYGNGIIGIAFSLFAIVLASMSLMTDFDNITQASNSGAPKYMEWYCAFGLTVTLVWLYTEILSLLAKFQSRD